MPLCCKSEPCKEECGFPNESQYAPLVLVQGLDNNGCIRYQDPLDLVDPCRVASQIPNGQLLTFVGKGVDGCLKSEDAQAVILRLETDWNGVSPLGSILITNDGNTAQNGHTPNLEVAIAPAQACKVNALSIIGGQGLFVAPGGGLNPIETSTIKPNFDPCNGNMQAVVKISPQLGNQVLGLGDGLFVQQGANAVTAGPLTGNGSPTQPIDIDFEQLDSVDRCDLGNNLPLGIVVTVAGGDASGCLIREDQLAFVQRNETDLVATDTSTIDFTQSGVNGHNLTGSVRLSVSPNNQIQALPDGLFVPQVIPNVNGPLTGNGITTPLDIDFGALTQTDRCALGNNIPAGLVAQVLGKDGVGCVVAQDATAFVQAWESDLIATDSPTIDFTATGTNNHNLTATVKVSGQAGNSLSVMGDGLYVSVPAFDCEQVQDCVAPMFSNWTVYDDINDRIIPVPSGLAGNQLTLAVDGRLYVPPAPTYTLDCEAVQDCVGPMFTPWGVYNDGAGVVQFVPSVVPGNALYIAADGRPYVATVTSLDCEQVQDCVGGMFSPWGSYDDANNVINFVPSTQVGNQLVLGVDGRPYVPPAATTTETTFAAVNSDSVVWTAGGTAGHTPTANVQLAPQQGCAANALRAVAGQGLFVPQTDTFSAEVYDLTPKNLAVNTFPTYTPTGVTTLTFTLCRPAKVFVAAHAIFDFGQFTTSGVNETVFTRFNIDGVAQIPMGVGEAPSLQVGEFGNADNSIDMGVFALAAGTHNVTLDYRTSGGSAPVTLIRAHIFASWSEVN